MFGSGRVPCHGSRCSGKDTDSLQSVMAASAIEPASFAYSLATQVLCAKSVPCADTVGTPLLRSPTVTPRVWIMQKCADAQLGKTTVNWKQRTLRFLHLVLAIENTPVFTRCSAQLANGEHKWSTLPLRNIHGVCGIKPSPPSGGLAVEGGEFPGGLSSQTFACAA